MSAQRTQSDAAPSSLPMPLVLPLAHLPSQIAGARIAAAGRPVGLFLGGLCVALGDAGSRAFAEWTVSSKGEGRIGRPLATILPAREVVPLLDPDALAPALHPV